MLCQRKFRSIPSHLLTFDGVASILNITKTEAYEEEKKMKSKTTCFLLALALVFIAAGCAGESKFERNASAVLNGLYNCPNADFLENVPQSKAFQASEKAEAFYTLYIDGDYLEDFLSRHGLQTHLLCEEANVTAKIKECKLEEKGDTIWYTAEVVCETQDTTKTVTLTGQMQKNSENKINFFAPDSLIDFYEAIGIETSD